MRWADTKRFRVTGAVQAALRPLTICALLAVLGVACSSSKEEQAVPPEVQGYRYTTDIPLSSLHVSSDDNSITVQVPENWRSASLDETGTDIILWLVNADYSASMSFMPIQMDPALYQMLKRDGLSAVTKVSMRLKDGNLDTPMEIVQPAEPFELDGRKFIAYEYTVNGKATVVRIVVFDTGTRFVECACVPAAEQLSPAEQRELFRIQQSVLQSMKIQ